MSAATGAAWMSALVGIPLAGAVLAFLLPARGTPIGFAAAAAVLISSVGLVAEVARHGIQEMALGGWQAPLGIVWRADGLAVLLLAMTAFVAAAATVFAWTHMRGRAPELARFWPLFLFLWAALNIVFLSRDVFHLYVALELSSLAAVAIVAVEGGAAALRGAMRYLLFALFGSLTYLLGVAVLYAGFGSLDFVYLAAAVEPSPAAGLALGLMTAGLFAKGALFPLHGWLPPAHSAAPAPGSALLSGVVVMSAVYILLRLWFEVFAAVPTEAARQLLGALGTLGVVWGSILALLQARLKLLIAYSTVAQLGYLLLIFPLAAGGPGSTEAFSGGVYLALAHGFAKAAMFLAAGLVLDALGHDRIHDIQGAAHHMPITVFALAVAGLTLMGLPPSGGFTAKWLMLHAALASGQWWWAAVLLGGGLLAAVYVFRILLPAFRQPGRQPLDFSPVPLGAEVLVLALAAGSLVLGLAAAAPLRLLQTHTALSFGALP